MIDDVKLNKGILFNNCSRIFIERKVSIIAQVISGYRRWKICCCAVMILDDSREPLLTVGSKFS